HIPLLSRLAETSSGVFWSRHAASCDPYCPWPPSPASRALPLELCNPLCRGSVASLPLVAITRPCSHRHYPRPRHLLFLPWAQPRQPYPPLLENAPPHPQARHVSHMVGHRSGLSAH